jgi:hypothetical protein
LTEINKYTHAGGTPWDSITGPSAPRASALLTELILALWPWLSVLSPGYSVDGAMAAQARVHAPNLRLGFHRVEDRKG